MNVTMFVIYLPRFLIINLRAFCTLFANDKCFLTLIFKFQCQLIGIMRQWRVLKCVEFSQIVTIKIITQLIDLIFIILILQLDFVFLE